MDNLVIVRFLLNFVLPCSWDSGFTWLMGKAQIQKVRNSSKCGWNNNDVAERVCSSECENMTVCQLLFAWLWFYKKEEKIISISE